LARAGWVGEGKWWWQWKGRGRHTIRRLADEAAPSTLGAFYETHFDLDFADCIIACIWVDLTLQWLEDE